MLCAELCVSTSPLACSWLLLYVMATSHGFSTTEEVWRRVAGWGITAFSWARRLELATACLCPRVIVEDCRVIRRNQCQTHKLMLIGAQEAATPLACRCFCCVSPEIDGHKGCIAEKSNGTGFQVKQVGPVCRL